VIGVGSLFTDKRWDRLLQAGGKLMNSGTSFKIQLVGEGPDRARLEAVCQRWNICQSVAFLGTRADVAGLLGQSSFLVLASQFEGCPNAVMEAMASGRAVVSTDVGDVQELVTEGETGFVVSRDDDQAFADRLRALILDPGLCKKMGLAGRAKAENEFGLDRLVDRTLAAYQEAKNRVARDMN
jgi:glycosyltransferase involved in cell wall biosynthesis